MNLLEVDLKKLISILGTEPSLGLTGEQVLRNRREFGENVLREGPHTASSLARKIFGDVMMILFLLTGLFDYLGNHHAVSLVCTLFVAALYVTLVFSSYSYTRKVYARVEKASRARVHVRRNGHVASVDAKELVPGDILILERGDVLPCDGVILSAREMRVLEVKGKGRPRAAVKRSHEEVSGEEGCPYTDCVLFTGSIVLQGTAHVFVCNTGENIFESGGRIIARQTGSIARIRQLALNLKREILLVWVLACFIIFAWGVLRGLDVFSAFYYGCAMVIAAFPSSIEHFCDLAEAYMTDRLFRAGAILRNPGAIDKLCDANAIFVNAADYLFYEKPTASLYSIGDREYDFRVDHVPAKPLLEDLILAAPSPAYLKDPRHVQEKKCERVIQASAARCSLQKRRLERDFMHIKQADPNARKNFACALVLRNESYRLIVRGDPASVLKVCSAYRSGPDDVPLTEGVAMMLRASFRRMAGNCERIVAAAELTLPSPPEGELFDHCRKMTFMGVFGLSTPVSAAAAEEVNSCAKNGIETYLLTDDYPETVESLAKSVSIIKEGDYQNALRYDSFRRMDRGVFVADVEQYKAYSQFPPEEKQNIIRYHRKNGDVTVSLTEGFIDLLPQMTSTVSMVNAADKTPAVRLNADVLLREKKFNLVPFCINWARILYQNVVHILQFTLLLQISLFFSVFLSLTLNRETAFPMPAMIFVCLGAALPCVFNIYHREPVSAMAQRPGILKDKAYSLQALIIMPAIAGLTGAVAVTLSRQIALFNLKSADAANGAALLTMAFAAWFASLSMKTETSVFRNLKSIGQTELATFLATLLVTLLTVFSPLARMYNPSFKENGAGLTAATGFLAVLLSLLPMLIMEFMKYLRKDASPRRRKASRRKKEPGFLKKIVEAMPAIKKQSLSEEEDQEDDSEPEEEDQVGENTEAAPQEAPDAEEEQAKEEEETTVESDLEKLLEIIQQTERSEEE